MPPRRSSRAAATNPPSQTTFQSTTKDLPRSRSQSSSKKRDTSSERTPSPPPKRSRTAPAQKPENDPPIQALTRKPSSRASKPASKTAKPTSKDAPTKAPLAPKKSRAKLSPVPETVLAPVLQQKPYFNPLPTPPTIMRPGLQLFAWGAGNFGQFGMGPHILGELNKPKKNVWVEQEMQKGTFGEVGSGLESIAGGGLHTLFIDEKGTVRATSNNLCAPLLIFSMSSIRSGLVV